MKLWLRDFDAEDARAASAAAAPVVPAEPEPIRSLPLEEVERLLAEARDTAFAQGRDAGAAETRAELEQARDSRAAATLEVIRAETGRLLAQEDRRRREMERDMVDLALDVAERIAPEFLAAYARDLAEARIRDGLRMAQGSARLSLRLSPEMAKALGPRLTDLAAPGGAVPDLVADAAVEDGAARLDWDGGGLSYSLDRLCAAVLDALREAAAKLKDDQEKAG